MFSGIVSALGTVQSIQSAGTTLRIALASPISGQLKIDQSISHNGICLTVVQVEQGMHQVEVVQETLSKTTFQFIKKGETVNLEKSITPSTLLDGHLIQGHVDTMLECLDIQDRNGSWQMKFTLPGTYAGLVIPHGSICLNGVSLTIANLYDDTFDVAVIPYTFEHTNFKYLRKKDFVNVEFDLVGKYLLRQANLRDRK